VRTQRHKAPRLGVSRLMRISASKMSASVYLVSVRAAEMRAVRLLPSARSIKVESITNMGFHLPAEFNPVVHAWRKSYTAVLRSLHIFDFIKAGCADNVCKVSTATSISSELIMELMLVESMGVASCGGLGIPDVVCFLLAVLLVPLRFRFVMVVW